MPIPIQPAPALLVGLGARILLDFLNRPEEYSIKDYILLGVWQGVALHYASKNSSLGPVVLAGIAGKLLVEFNFDSDVNKTTSTVIGVLLGFLGTDLITQFVDSAFAVPIAPSSERRRRKVSFSMPPSRDDKRRHRQSRSNLQGGNEANRYTEYHPVSDITSVDSNSDLIRATENMTPLEREVAALRARASLADSERRRYREERKWAISEGNLERAAELKQQVKRYTVLMQGFHREADTKMISGLQSSQTNANGSAVEVSRTTTTVITSQPRIRKSSLTNGNNKPQPSSSSRDPRPGPSTRPVQPATASIRPAPIIIRREPTR